MYSNLHMDGIFNEIENKAIPHSGFFDYANHDASMQK